MVNQNSLLATNILTFREFVVAETLPLSTVHQAIFEFLRHRNDVVLFGAQAVNAYVDEARMTQDIDLLSNQAAQLADALKADLHAQFHIAIRVREVVKGQGYRLYQAQKSGNRHLVDIRQVSQLPHSQRIAEILVMAPANLIASKVIAYCRRQGSPKAGTDWRDLAMLLLKFPELKQTDGPVSDLLSSSEESAAVFELWHTLVAQDIQPSTDDDEFSW